MVAGVNFNIDVWAEAGGFFERLQEGEVLGVVDEDADAATAKTFSERYETRD